MLMLNVKPKEQCQFDLVALGEIMLRLDPGERRVRCARDFTVWKAEVSIM